MYTELKSEAKTTIYSTDIIITPTLITIKKWYNGKTEDAKLKVNRKVDQLYMGTMCTWYYCTDVKKDELSGTYYQAICVYDKIENSFIFASFADEITMYWHKFYLK